MKAAAGPEQATPLRGGYAKSAQRRREIIAAAVAVFSEHGFRDGTLRDVADRAGITHAGVRHHFPSKAALLQAVLRWREDDSVERAGHPDGLDLIRAWLADVEHNLTRPRLVELETVVGAEAISDDHPAHDYFNHLYSYAEELLTRAFTTAGRRDELRPGIDPAAAAQIVLAQTVGLQTLWLHDRTVDVTARLTEAVSLMLTVDLSISQ